MNLTHTLSNSRSTHFALRVLAVTLLLIGGFALKGHPVSAATQNAVASIYDPVTHQALASGGSAEPFTVVLPAGAACSGDTQSGGYHVFSYLVHSGTSIPSLTFPAGQPGTGYGLFDVTGYYGNANTAANTGQIVSIPNDFQWSVLSSGVPVATLLYSGTSGVWDSGLLCTDTNGAVTDWWNTAVTFTAADAATDANGFTWAATPGGGVTPPAATTTTTAPKTRVTTTTKPHVTTTTRASTGDPTTTTTSAGDPTATTVVSSGSGDTPTDPIDTSSGFSDPTATGGGTLPRTGSPVNREVGLGLLAIGAGMMIIGFEWRWKARGAFAG